MCAYAQHDQPLGFLDAVFVFLRISEDVDAAVDVSSGNMEKIAVDVAVS